jgi:septum formation protein
MQIYLGSRSPRRQQLLSQIGITFKSLAADINESVNNGESAVKYVERMAVEKADAAWQLAECAQDAPLLSADTCIAFHDEILGKPLDNADAMAMLTALSGQTHQVLTSVAVRNEQRTDIVTSITQVTFGELSEQLISTYVNSGDCMDKAGSYGIQGYAARFVSHIDGSYSGVVGLPLYETAKLLETFKIFPSA